MWCASINNWKVLHTLMASDTRKLASLGLWDYSILFTVQKNWEGKDWFSQASDSVTGSRVIGAGFIDILRPTSPHPSVVEAALGTRLGAQGFRQQRLRLAEKWAERVMTGVFARLLLGSDGIQDEILLMTKKHAANIIEKKVVR